MHYSQTAALFILLFVMMINDRQYIQSSVIQYDSCNMICGINARCRTLIQRKRRVCSCYNLSLLRPLPSLCHRAFECLDNAACNYNRICKNKRCVDPCVGLCGVNTNCVTRNHMGFCQCLPGYEGDPFLGCQVIDPLMMKSIDKKMLQVIIKEIFDVQYRIRLQTKSVREEYSVQIDQ